MTPHRVKLGCADTFMKYLASIVSLIFLQKTLIWNKFKCLALNSINFAELVENELIKSISEKIGKYSFIYPIYRCLMLRF